MVAEQLLEQLQKSRKESNREQRHKHQCWNARNQTGVYWAIGDASKAGLLAMAQSSESWPFGPQMSEPRDEGAAWAWFGASGC